MAIAIDTYFKSVSEHTQDMHSFLCHSWTVTLREELVQPVVFLDRDGAINKNRLDYKSNLFNGCKNRNGI